MMHFNVFFLIPGEYPCKSTIWDFREKLTNKNLAHDIWNVFKQYLVEKTGLSGKYVRQDASFYTADKGQKKKDYPSWSTCKNTKVTRWRIHEKKTIKPISDLKYIANKTWKHNYY